MSEKFVQDGWRVEVTIDRSCIPCILAANDDDLGGVMINRRDKMMSVYNYEIISSDECAAEGNHNDLQEADVQGALDRLVASGQAVQVVEDGVVKYRAA